MNQRQALTSELIATIASDIEQMPPKPASRCEVDLLIAGIASHVRAAQARELNYDDIAAQITDSGYPIKACALRKAMLQFDKHDAQARDKKRRRTGHGAASRSSSSPTVPPSP